MMRSKTVRLGDYIEQCDERNVNNHYGLSALRGVSINKTFIDTKANMEDVSLTPYKLVKPLEICYVSITSRNGGKISLAINQSQETYIVSSSYIVLRVKDKNILDPEYLFLLFNRPEFDRYSRFNSWGSAREAFSYESMELTRIPLPSIEKQREIVAIWKSLRRLKEENEKIAEPLMAMCMSKIQELWHSEQLKELKPYISRVDNRNTNNIIKEVRSVSVKKEFNETNAKVDKNNLSNYKIVRESEISFVPTTGNEKCLCAAINHLGFPIVVTSVNEVFKTDREKLLPDYLHLIFRRKETDRYARYHSWGSARETFNWSDMERFRVPVPSIEVQQAIVDFYECAQRAKTIAAEADRQLKTICPALIQYVKHN